MEFKSDKNCGFYATLENRRDLTKRLMKQYNKTGVIMKDEVKSTIKNLLRNS